MSPQNLISHLLLIFCIYWIDTCCSLDSITAARPLRDINNDTIVSSQGTFRLGFFSPPNTQNRYLGIWYNKIRDTDVIWVANRMNPLNDSSGAVRISRDGNLQLLNGLNETLWSSNVSMQRTNSPTVARLLDSGNLVLLPIGNGTALWQSFEHPTDSILPSMTVTNKGSKDIRKLVFAWKSPSDPAYGRFSAGLDSFTLPEIIILDGDVPHWRSGPWNGNLFIGIPYNNSDNTNSGFVLQTDRRSEISLTYTYTASTFLTNYELNYDGTVLRKLWVEEQQKWVTEWKAPLTECDLYGKCGAFGICNSEDTVICECQKGFQPKNKEKWIKGNWSAGCTRRKPLQCGVRGGTPDKFFRLKNVKNPAQAIWSLGLDQNQCRDLCIKNCSCTAYAFDSGAGCMSWYGDLLDTQTLSAGGVDLYIRLEHSELAESWKHVTVKVVIISFGAAIVLLIICFMWWKKAKERGRRLLKKKTLRDIFGGEISPEKFEELPLFEIERLQIATNFFHESNQLGRGGFGPVYKGKLENGQEIAVKRLSRASGQGIEEFVNEVKVISKLQHRNLVRLLGCCVEGEEKMLVYEYMPNKSLDAILFDEQKREILSWTKRFNIIDGICRGLLYLHRDSRLKIIHRDLKPSNILLDEKLNPKISDFGMARIFVENEDHADTRRVVGTYGYMPPEYALEGKFSEKSDVFSFGVLLLEIVSGIKNSQFWHPEESLTLPGFAWKLWKEGNIDPLFDKTLNEPQFHEEILTCVNIGLLCVQEFAKDRPNISTVIHMLSNDAKSLPVPKKPAYVTRQDDNSEIGSSNKSYQASKSSINDVSITIISSGR